MAWIESHTVLTRHRKLIELAKDLRLKPVYVMGHLHSLWHAALEQQEDGDLTSWSDDFIAESSSFQGDALQFVQLLQKHKWLDGKTIHDWMEYAGKYLDAKYRTSNPEKLNSIRKKHSLTKDGLKTDLKRTLDRPPNQPNLTKPNQQKTKDRNFSPPTIEEVKNYCVERKNKIDPQKWHDFYTSKGWMVGKNKMKDWRAAVRTWEKREESAPIITKRPAFFVIQEYRVLKFEKQRMKSLLLEKGYTEHDIEEAFYQDEKQGQPCSH